MATVPDLGYIPTLPVFVKRVSETYAGRDFIVSPDNRLSFRDAEVLSGQLARKLLAEGCDKGTRVGFMFGSSPEWVVVWLAITRIGGVAIPFSTMYRPAELRQVLEITDTEIMISPTMLLGKDQRSFLEAAIPELVGSSPPFRLLGLSSLRRVYLVGGEVPGWARPIDIWGGGADAGLVSDGFFAGVEASVCPADIMLIVCTSGTTAEPKAVLHTHGAWVRHTSNNADSTDEPYGERIYGGMPFFWVGGLSTTIGTAMHRGSAILCTEKPDPDVVADLLVRERCTKAMMWPSQFDRVKERLGSRSWGDDGPPPFLVAPSGPVVDPRRRAQSLGMTETLAAYIVSGPADHVIPDEFLGAHGFKVPHMQYRIADPVSGETLADGEEGEICVRGYNLMVGMCRKERHEYLDDDGWYHTGDRGKLGGPYVFFTGRIKDLIKSSGANVSPREVEAVLNGAEGVLLSLVVGVPDPLRQEVVGAVVAPRLGAKLDAGDLAAYCREVLSAYKVPRRIAIVEDTEVPLGATGKAKTNEVRDLILERGVEV